MNNSTGLRMNATENVEISKGVSLLAIWLLAVVGNLLSIVIVSRYKLRRIPDILVVSLACTDLVGTAFPIPVSTFLYFSGESTLDDNCALCQAYAVVAQFTRYSAALLVTLMLVDRCVWILRPIRYHHGVFRPFFCVSVVIMWLMAAALSLVSLGSHIDAGENTCLFRMNTWYGVVIAVFGGVQFLTVFVCFCIIIVEVAKLARRRRKMVVNRGKSCAYTLSGKTKIADKDKASIQENGEVKSETNENSKSSSSCGQKMKQLVKCMKEKIHPSAEQQFAIMFSAIVVLFYISWLPIIVMVVYTIATDMNESSESHREALFYTIRLTVVSTAVNPFLYGFFGKAYRRAYIYYFRRIFGKCLPCVHFPEVSENPYNEDSRT